MTCDGCGKPTEETVPALTRWGDYQLCPECSVHPDIGEEMIQGMIDLLEATL